jgi:hypothetical protein
MRVDFAHLSKNQRDHNANDIHQLVNAGAGCAPKKKTSFDPAPILLSNPGLRVILRA